eukprot:1843432-Prymnesium_polylepis.1
MPFSSRAPCCILRAPACGAAASSACLPQACTSGGMISRPPGPVTLSASGRPSLLPTSASRGHGMHKDGGEACTERKGARRVRRASSRRAPNSTRSPICNARKPSTWIERWCTKTS